MAGSFATVPQEITMIVSSDPKSGAVNRSSDGSYFEINLEDGLHVPKEALNVNVEVEDSTVWWTVPNIITGVNDLLFITGPNTSDVSTLFTVTIPQGLYDLSGLNEAIARELEQAGAKIDPDPLISLSPDEATQRVEIRFSYAGTSIDFTQAQTPRDILGFDALVYSITGGNPQLAPNTAAFNTINYFLIHSDLTNKGIRINNNYSQTLTRVLIDVPPGSQIVSQPFNPPRINAEELAGTKRTTLRFWLTDDENRRVNTAGEYWSARIVIHYLMPMVVQKSPF
jgi:hypothetical protein